ncbi:MAG: hypothetical protein AB8G77_23655 [Rhodothermales bacterium]
MIDNVSDFEVSEKAGNKLDMLLVIGFQQKAGGSGAIDSILKQRYAPALFQKLWRFAGML